MGKNSKKLANIVGDVAPKLGKVLGFFGVPGAEVSGDILGKLGKKFGISDTEPDKIAEVIAQDPDAALKLKEFELEHDVEMNKIIADTTIALEKEETAKTRVVNKTMQAEYKTDNWFKSSWRPLFGYLLAIDFSVFVFFILYLAHLAVNKGNPAAIQMIPTLVSAFTILFGAGFAVVGVTVHSRGHEKLAKMGVEKPGILASIGAIIKK
jgi:hypothetical protein